MPEAGNPLWKISPFGEIAQREKPKFAHEVKIVDCTLRDGEQQAGIVFTKDDKIEIAKALDALGVYEIEAGTPVSSNEDREAIEAIAGLGLKPKISALARGRRDDIDVVAKTGSTGVRLSIPISAIQRAVKLNLDDDAYIKLALEMTGYAKELGLTCIFSPYDTTRCDLDLLRRLLGEFARHGTVDRVRLVDTTGCGTPSITRYLVHEMRQAADIPIEVHCHDDFGLAVANTIAGVEEGAEYVSATINGIGERCGNASLEECVVALKVLYGLDAGIDTTRFLEVSHLVEERSGVKLQPHKAVVGQGAFAHESGMVVAGVLKDPFTAEPYVPELVGQRRTIVLGKKSGLASVQARLGSMGVEATQEQLRALLEAVKSEAIRTKRPVDESQFGRLVETIVSRDAAAQS